MAQPEHRDARAGHLMEVLGATIAWLTDPANWSGPDGIPVRLASTSSSRVVSLLIALAIALPVGLWIGHTGRGAALAVNLANLGPGAAVTGGHRDRAADHGRPSTPSSGSRSTRRHRHGPAGHPADPGEHQRRDHRGRRATSSRPPRRWACAAASSSGGSRSRSRCRSSSAASGVPRAQIVATATLGAIFGRPGWGGYLVEGIAQADDGMVFGGVVLVAALVARVGTAVRGPRPGARVARPAVGRAGRSMVRLRPVARGRTGLILRLHEAAMRS